MSALLRVLPIAALLGAWVSVAERPATKQDLDPAWTSKGFARSLEAAAEKARMALREAPEVAWAEISVRSIDDHAPLRVEASIDWAAEAVADARKEVLLAAVRSHFDSFARVDVVAK